MLSARVWRMRRIRGRICEEAEKMSEKEKILSASDIVVQFQLRNKMLTAIRHVSLDLYEGETLAIVGESGSGKSVLTKTFTGMLDSNGHIESGTCMFEGKNLYDIKTDAGWEKIRGKKIATVFQDPMTSLNPIIPIGRQITEVIEKHQGKSKEEAKAMAIQLMEEVGIYNAAGRFDEYPFQYSGGMRQRIVIAIALACHPKILICDEPTTALDVTIQAQIIRLIKDLQSQYGYTTIYITHDLGVVANVADRVAVMYAGQIIEYGLVDEVFYDPKHPYTWGLLSSLPQLGIKGSELYAITGTPPSLFDVIKGDAFAPRNPYAMEIDFEEEPPFFKVSDTHYAKTWLLDPRAPKVTPPQQVTTLHERMQEALIKQEKQEGLI
jgi:oligopeptide transport system ATP-binding protein